MGKERIETNEDFFRKILEVHKITPDQKKFIETSQIKLEKVFQKHLNGEFNVFYGGSLEKKTMIREECDLYVIINFPPQTTDNIENIYSNVGKILNKKWKKSRSKSIGWESQLKNYFHINIIPGIEIKPEEFIAYYYNSDNQTQIETNIKAQISHISNSNREDLIKLMKLWKIRRNVPIKSFILEELAIIGSKGVSRIQLEKQILQVFRYIHDNIESKKIYDPANQNNVISDLIKDSEKTEIKNITLQALQAKNWGKVFKS